jgi:cell division protein FtsI/penicillin-binding protein 2
LLLAVLFSCYRFLASSISAYVSQNLENKEKKASSILELPAHLDYYTGFANYPAPDTFTHNNNTLVALYRTDSLLNARISIYLNRYRPENAVFLVSDLKTGGILGLGERKDSLISEKPNLAFGRRFPAASLIKMVTAFAALETGIRPSDSLVQIGSYHTLYKRQLRIGSRAKSPKITFKRAFARSVNPAFGLLGIKIGPEALKLYAEQLRFNNHDVPPQVQPSIFIVPDSGYALAEVSCGFTQSTTISPLHALEICGTIGGNGRWKPAFFSDSLLVLNQNVFRPVPTVSYAPKVMSAAILEDMQELMQATVSRGTSRSGIGKILKRHHLEKLIIGGKTGSLDGPDPKGRYDWFIGYAKLKEKEDWGIAIVVMQVHQTYQSLRSTRVAALLIRDWLRQQNRSRQTASAS